MSFFNWFSSKKESAEANWQEKRRSTRLDLAENELSFHLLHPEERDSGSTLVASVKNVSLFGCRVELESLAQGPKIEKGQIFVAALGVQGFAIPLKVEVVRVLSDRELGIRFRPPFPRELERLEKFLEPRFLGVSLREIDPASLQKEEKKNLRWFQGLNDTHLFSWVDTSSQAVVQQQLVFLEKVVEWRSDGALKTGHVRSDHSSKSSGPGWVESELLEFDPKINESTLQQARVLIQSARIDETVKKHFLDKVHP